MESEEEKAKREVGKHLSMLISRPFRLPGMLGVCRRITPVWNQSEESSKRSLMLGRISGYFELEDRGLWRK